MADKMVAFAFRQRRIKPRDEWDITWLRQRGHNARHHACPPKIRSKGKIDSSIYRKHRARFLTGNGRQNNPVGF